MGTQQPQAGTPAQTPALAQGRLCGLRRSSDNSNFGDTVGTLWGPCLTCLSEQGTFPSVSTWRAMFLRKQREGEDAPVAPMTFPLGLFFSSLLPCLHSQPWSCHEHPTFWMEFAIATLGSEPLRKLLPATGFSSQLPAMESICSNSPVPTHTYG